MNLTLYTERRSRDVLITLHPQLFSATERTKRARVLELPRAKAQPFSIGCSYGMDGYRISHAWDVKGNQLQKKKMHPFLTARAVQQDWSSDTV